MNTRWMNILWGIVLIVAGLLFMAQNLNAIPEVPPLVWVGVFTLACLLFAVSYVISGLDQWGWLFPALISGAVALTILLTEAGGRSSIVGVPVLVSIGAPFVVAYALDRGKNGWALIPAWVMFVVSMITATADWLPGTWTGTLVLLAIALPFVVVYLRDRLKWWALISAWALVVIALVVAISERASGQLTGVVIMAGLAVPFLVVYFRDRRHWWALVPAGVFGVVGIIILLSMEAGGELMGALVLFLFALPFLAVYLWSVENWWALIPGGIFCGVALAILLTGGDMAAERRSSVMSGIMFLVWAAAFLVLWLRRERQPTAWAVYPAIVLGAGGLVALLFGVEVTRFWPLVPIVVGVALLYSALRERPRDPVVAQVDVAVVDAPSVQDITEVTAGAEAKGDRSVQDPA